MHIVGCILLGLFLIVCIFFLVLFAKHTMMFSTQKCPKCGSYMDYKGIKETADGAVYLFYCPKCDKLEEVSEKELNTVFYNMDNNQLNFG